MTSFIDAVRTIIKLAEKERLIFVMDEFPYLAKRDGNAVSSVLQNLIDNAVLHCHLWKIQCLERKALCTGVRQVFSVCSLSIIWIPQSLFHHIAVAIKLLCTALQGESPVS